MELKPGYKQTEVGVIPEDWGVRQITEVCDFIVPGRNKPKFFDGPIPWITTPDLVDGGSVLESRLGLAVSRDEARSVGSKIVPTGSVVMSCVGELGIVAYAEREIVINQQLHAFIPREPIDGHFLMHAIQTRKPYLDSIATKTALPYLNKDNCNSIRLPFPPILEQRAIAQALSDVDALISSLDQLFAKKRDTKQATMQQLLTGKQRLPGFGGEWKTKFLGDVTQIVSGGTPKTSIPEYWDGGIPWCTPTDITGSPGKYLQETARTISPQGLAASSATLLPAGSLLLCSRATIGELKIATTPVSTNQGFKALICGGAVNNEFLYYLLLTMKAALVERASGSTFLEISKGDTARLEIRLPQPDEQTAIASVLSDMDNEIAALEDKRDKTLALKQGMMQELLTGRIRLV